MSSTLLLPLPANSFVIGPAVRNTHIGGLFSSARVPDVAVVISLRVVYTPVDDNVTAPLCSKQASKWQRR